MAVNPNQTSEATASKLFTGLATFKVVAINPNQAKLKELGYKAEKEPTYKSDAGQRVSFFLEAQAGDDVVRTNVAFFLKDKIRADVFINKQGKFGKDRSQITGEVRNPYDGEIDLLNFISDWCNIKKDEEMFLESIEKIVKIGDIFELRDLHEKAKNNVFKALCVVRDGKYQGVYEKRFVRSWSSDLSYLHKSLVQNEQYLKFEIGPIDLKLFVPEQFDLRQAKRIATVSEELATTPISSNGAHDTQAEQAAPATDDAPF